MDSYELHQLRVLATKLNLTANIFPHIENYLESSEPTPADDVYTIHRYFEWMREDIKQFHEIVYMTQTKIETPKKKFFWRK